MDVELEPRRLEEELNSVMRKYSPVRIFYDKGKIPRKVSGILRCSTIETILHPANRPTSSLS